jgi:hypothetical protein
MGTWTYLVTFDTAVNKGNAVVTRPRPIDSASEVMDVEAWVRNNGAAGAVLSNVVLLKRRRFARWVDGGTTVRRSSDPVPT